ncbi:MAG TPA: hypothetical protein VLY66_00080 [Candidatus Eisenbacteria bacterium]|nr:hypothetical protein [Candidatus Eisenbacteria bacterium]
MFPSLHDTLPVAILVEFEISDTVAVNVIDPPEDTVEGLGVRVRVVESSVLTRVELEVEVGTFDVLDTLALDEDELFAVDVNVLPLEVLEAAALDEDELLAVDVYGSHTDDGFDVS